MKKSVSFTVTTRIAALLIAVLCLTVCAWGAPNPVPGNGNSGSGIETSMTGTIDHEQYTKGQSGTCSFSDFPTSVEEFRAVQEQIGTEPQGAVALVLMAIKMYGDDEALGKECLEISMRQLYPSYLSLVKDKMRPRSPSDDYAQPFLPLAYLKGATPENGYSPSKPYTVEVAVNNSRPYSKLSSANAQVIYLSLKTKGADSGTRPIEVIKPSGSNFFVVNNIAGIISQVKFPVK